MCIAVAQIMMDIKALERKPFRRFRVSDLRLLIHAFVVEAPFRPASDGESSWSSLYYSIEPRRIHKRGDKYRYCKVC